MTLLPTNIATGNSSHIAYTNQVNKKTNAWIDIVADYGADPTGVGSSSAAIQAAVDAAVTADGLVYAPGGNYKMSSVVNIPADMWFKGIGWDRTVFLPDAGVTAFNIRGLETSMEDFEIRYSASNANNFAIKVGDHGTSPYLASKNYFKRLKLQGSGYSGRGIWSYSALECAIEACYIKFFDFGIHLAEPHSDYPSNAWTIDKSLIRENKWGVLFAGDTHISGCTIEGNCIGVADDVLNDSAANNSTLKSFGNHYENTNVNLGTGVVPTNLLIRYNGIHFSHADQLGGTPDGGRDIAIDGATRGYGGTDGNGVVYAFGPNLSKGVSVNKGNVVMFGAVGAAREDVYFVGASPSGYVINMFVNGSSRTRRYQSTALTTPMIETPFVIDTDDQTGVYVTRRQSGVITSQPVTQGATDSGGSGFKVLRVPN